MKLGKRVQGITMRWPCQAMRRTRLAFRELGYCSHAQHARGPVRLGTLNITLNYNIIITLNCFANVFIAGFFTMFSFTK